MSSNSNIESLEVPPSAFQRWLGSVPMFVTFWINVRGVIDLTYSERIFRSLRIDLPLPTKVALAWMHFVQPLYLLWMPAMFAVSWFYFGWATKSHRRYLSVNIFFSVTCLLALIALIGGNILPLIKIQEALRKR